MNVPEYGKSLLGLMTDGTWELREKEELTLVMEIEIFWRQTPRFRAVTVLPRDEGKAWHLIFFGQENLENGDAMDKTRLIIVIVMGNLGGSVC